MEKVIITGASGMIGATMIEQMIEDHIEIAAIIRPGSLKRSNIVNHSLVKIYECDIDNLLSLKSKLGTGFDTFYHFAWNGTYGDSRNEVSLQTNNIKNAIEAVELASYLGCHTYVGAGSQAEFGRVKGKISDIQPKNPLSGYGIAKLAACNLTKIRCEQLGIRHSWGRIVSTYGPRDNDYTMIMSAVSSMSEGRRLSFTKGEQLWDYLYVGDCAKAFYLIGEYGKHGKAYTIGSGETRRLKDFIETIREVVNPEVEIGLGEREYFSDQVMELCADIEELKEDTGFERTTSFEEGIKKTLEWYRDSKGRKTCHL